MTLYSKRMMMASVVLAAHMLHSHTTLHVLFVD